MSASYLPYHPQQQFLLPPSLEEWLPQGHLAYYIGDAVDQLDLSAFHARYAKDGPRNQPFHPAMMVKVLVYGYATGVFSSRKIAAKLHEDVAFRVLGAGNFPKHRTLSDFRALHLQELGQLFVQVVRLARECGLVKLGTIAVDGTKLKANASRHKAMSYQRMVEEQAKLEAEIGALLERARCTDEKEDAEPQLDIPAELERREKRLEMIRAARERLQARQADQDTAQGREPGDERQPRHPDGTPKRGRRYKREFGEPEDKQQDNFTDPDSRIMKTKDGFQQCYNAQAAVDAASQVIVAQGLTQSATDRNQLQPLVEGIEALAGRAPKEVSADADYCSEESLEALERRGIRGYVATGKQQHGLSAPVGEGKRGGPLTQKMRQRLRQGGYRSHYRLRKQTVEPVFGQMKAARGFRQFLLRGAQKVSGEWALVCIAHNLLKLAKTGAA
jgi:transposase